jgi:hypothetical protein
MTAARYNYATLSSGVVTTETLNAVYKFVEVTQISGTPVVLNVSISTTGTAPTDPTELGAFDFVPAVLGVPRLFPIETVGAEPAIVKVIGAGTPGIAIVGRNWDTAGGNAAIL